MQHVQPWTPSHLKIEKERLCQLARIGNNLNQLARWANTHTGHVNSVEVITALISIEHELMKYRQE